MKIMSLNVNQFRSEGLLSEGRVVVLLQMAVEFLEENRNGVVFFYEMPKALSKSKLDRMLTSCKAYCLSEKGAIRTIAIVRRESDWSFLADTRFTAGMDEKGREHYANRHVELWNERHGLRLLGIHAPLEPKSWKTGKCEWDEEGVYIPVKGFFNQLKKYACKRQDDKFIILGDMNVHSEEGCYYYWKFEEIQSVDGYTDLIPRETPTYFPNGHTLDHVLVSKNLKGKVTARVDVDIRLSDHAVIIVDVQE